MSTHDILLACAECGSGLLLRDFGLDVEITALNTAVLGDVRNMVKHGRVDKRYRPRCPRNARRWHAAVSCGRVVLINPPHEASTLSLLRRTSLKHHPHILDPSPIALEPLPPQHNSTRPHIADI